MTFIHFRNSNFVKLVSSRTPAMAEAVASLVRSSRFRLERVSSRLENVSSSNLQSVIVNIVSSRGASHYFHSDICR